jgi:hypothetical protein
MYALALRNDLHVRRFTVQHMSPAGWAIIDQCDADVLKAARYDDWHRVERAMVDFAIEAAGLRERGWTDA